MTEKEIKETIRKMKKFSKELSASPKKAREFLMAAGICNKDGSLREPYKS